MTENVVEAGLPLRPEDVLTHETMYSRTTTLSEDEDPRLIVEGGISLGRIEVTRLPDKDASALPSTTDGSTFVLVKFAFDLDRPIGSRRFLLVGFDVELADPGAVAHSLWPALVHTDDDVERARECTVADDFSLISMKSAYAGRRPVLLVRYAELEPRIDASGPGRARFSWRIEPLDGRRLRPYGHVVFAVLELPPSITTLTGLMTATAQIEKSPGGLPDEVTSRANLCLFTVALPAVGTPAVRTPAGPVSLFISYAYESDQHVRQVARLAGFLTQQGYAVVIDTDAEVPRGTGIRGCCRRSSGRTT